MGRLRALAIAIALLPGSALVIASAPAACAADAAHAALVVDTGSRVHTFCVTLDAASVSGLELIELAGDQHGLDYRLGLGGAAVCSLASVGVDGDDCFDDYPDFWGYWHGDERGGWTWASTGGAGYRVEAGDVEGWVWGSGDTGTTHPEPPPVGLDDVCQESAEPTPEPTQPAASPQPTRAGSGSNQGDGSSAPPETSSTQTDPGSDDPPPSRSHDGSRSWSATPSDDSSEGASLAAAAPPPDDGGAPTGLIMAIALGAALGAGGWLRHRSGRAVASGAPT